MRQSPQVKSACTSRMDRPLTSATLAPLPPTTIPQSSTWLSTFFLVSNFSILFVGVTNQYFFSASSRIFKSPFFRCYISSFNLIFFFEYISLSSLLNVSLGVTLHRKIITIYWCCHLTHMNKVENPNLILHPFHSLFTLLS